MNSLVSISIVTWNSERYIYECVKHLLAQTYTNISITIIDNASSDSTTSIVRKHYPQVRILENTENTGFAAAHNKGIRETNSEFVLVLNPDIYLTPSFIEELVASMRKYPTAGTATGLLYRIEEHETIPSSSDNLTIDSAGFELKRNRRFTLRGYGLKDVGQYAKEEFVFGADGAAPLFRRVMLEDTKVDGEYFDEIFFAHKEDQDFAWRSQILGWSTIFCPRAKAFHIRNFRPASLKDRNKQSVEIRQRALRNQYLMMIKNECRNLFLRDFIFIFSYNLLTILYLIIFEPVSLRGILEVFQRRRQYWDKRIQIQKRKKILTNNFSLWIGKK